MICNLESLGAREASASYGTIRRPVQKRVKLHRIQRGSDVIGILADERNRPLAVVANGLSDGLRKLLDRFDFNGPAGQCSALQICLGAGYVYSGYHAADWLTKEARMLMELRPHVEALLGPAKAAGQG